MDLIPVILCGGSGTRLWPLSRKALPKQFVPVVGGKSLLRMTVERLALLGGEPLLVASEEHRFLVTEALQAVGTAGSLILEPLARNTAPAMTLAALQAGAQADRLLLFSPADHHVPDMHAFANAVRRGMAAAMKGAIVTFGVQPTYPSTAYGYIREGPDRGDGSRKVEAFVEKPDAALAANLLLQGNMRWNSGVFLCAATTLLAALELHAPDILDACREAMGAASVDEAPGGYRFVRPDSRKFAACRSQSIDYALMESYANVVVVPFDSQWSDVGNWAALADLSPPDSIGNRVTGNGRLHGATNTFIHAGERPVVALGTHDLLIVDTIDALLVAHRDCAEDVKDVVAGLQASGCPQATSHRKVARPWGSYDCVDAGDRFQVKRLRIRANASLSLQQHFHRAEHWVVVKGTAEVTRGGETFLLRENESTFIPAGEVHRLRNPGHIELEIIEVQSGSYLGEDDIVRLDDAYGRR